MWSLRPAHHPSEIYMNTKKLRATSTLHGNIHQTLVNTQVLLGGCILRTFAVRHIMWYLV